MLNREKKLNGSREWCSARLDDEIVEQRVIKTGRRKLKHRNPDIGG